MNLDALSDPEAIVRIVQGLIVLLLSICVHEYGHAIVADKLGDPLPRSQGRTSLNPLVHADPIGTFLFPLIFMVMSGGRGYGFGWGKPVLTNPRSYTRKLTMRKGHLLVAAAGPAMNVLFGVFLCFVCVGLLKFGVLQKTDQVTTALISAVSLNFILCFFNLIPAPPLDGGAVVEGLLPDSLLPAYKQFAVYGPFVLMAVIFIGPLSVIFTYPADLLTGWVFTGVKMVFGF